MFMKRIGLIGVCFGMVLLLTGCGSKELRCSISNENIDYQMNLTFDSEDLLDTGVMRQTYKLTEEQEDTLEEGVQYLKEVFEDNDQYEGFEINITDNGKNEVYVDIAFDASELSEIMGEELDESATYDSIREELENEGYVCE